MSMQGEPSEAVRRIAASLAAGVPADRLAALLAPEMPSVVVEQLLSQPRFTARLSRMMMSRLDLTLPDDLSPDLQFAALGAHEMGSAICAVGAIWHYNVIRQVIARPVLQSLIDAISDKAHTIALANGELAVAPSSVPSVANLACAIQRAGHSCVEAWLETVEPPVAELTRLKLPPPPQDLAPITIDHRRHGPAIVRRVAASWHTIDGEA